MRETKKAKKNIKLKEGNRQSEWKRRRNKQHTFQEWFNMTLNYHKNKMYFFLFAVIQSTIFVVLQTQRRWSRKIFCFAWIPTRKRQQIHISKAIENLCNCRSYRCIISFIRSTSMHPSLETSPFSLRFQF